jgi:hypothetical protein
MKTILHYLTTLTLFLFFTSHLSAQGIRFGIKAGMNYSSMYDQERSPNFNPSPKEGFAGGAFLSIDPIPIIGFQPEIMFSQKGYRAYGNNYEYELTSNHLDVPLLLKLKPAPFLHFVGGPMYSYTLSENERFTSGNLTRSQQSEFKTTVNKNTMAAIAGLDINIRHIVLSGRASWDLFNNNGDGTTTSPRYKNFFAQATIGYRF